MVIIISVNDVLINKLNSVTFFFSFPWLNVCSGNLNWRRVGNADAIRLSFTNEKWKMENFK